MKICERCGHIVKDDDVCWHCYVHNDRPRVTENTSTNIGIPEKRERADMQYHGGQFYNGEW